MKGLASLIVIMMSGSLGYAQSTLAFEAASIKPSSGDDDGSSYRFTKGQLLVTNESLRDLIKLAFHLKDYSFAGPSWLDSVRFDIVAKPPSGSDTKQFPLMLQKLLADRFHLTVHHESKLLNGYAMTVAKGGFKLKPVEPGDSATGSGRSGLTGNRVALSRLAEQIADLLERPVQDLTGIGGVYDYHLDFSVKEEDHTRPPLFTALQEQFGLHIEVRKVAVDVVVVDHVDRVPTEN
jgi:uncharacterized protein (TIGR03435 family)